MIWRLFGVFYVNFEQILHLGVSVADFEQVNAQSVDGLIILVGNDALLR